MRIFIDLGAADGDTIEVALKKYKKLDKVYAFEPLRENFEKLTKKFGGRKDFILINAAASVADGEGKLYFGKEWGNIGGSLCANKFTCHKDKFENVKALDFSSYVIKNCDVRDEIILKVDIEGTEYELLEKMIKDGSINYISELFCEWHYGKIGVSYERHQGCLRQLRKIGFNLTGDNGLDEFMLVWQINNIKLQAQRYSAYYIKQLKYFLKNRFSVLYAYLKFVYKRYDRWRNLLGSQTNLYKYKMYGEYVRAQEEANIRKLSWVWAEKEEIRCVADRVKKNIPGASFGICHGSRNGMEVKWFREFLGIEIIGTDIAKSAKDFPNLIQWDFHKVKEEWIGNVDFIYSNAFDHSCDPKMCLDQWMKCIKNNGLCFIEWTEKHAVHNRSDPFGGSRKAYEQLIKRKYKIQDILIVKAESFSKDEAELDNANFFRSGRDVDRHIFVVQHKNAC